jgi:hypothetical protein
MTIEKQLIFEEIEKKDKITLLGLPPLCTIQFFLDV